MSKRDEVASRRGTGVLLREESLPGSVTVNTKAATGLGRLALRSLRGRRLRRPRCVPSSVRRLQSRVSGSPSCDVAGYLDSMASLARWLRWCDGGGRAAAVAGDQVEGEGSERVRSSSVELLQVASDCTPSLPLHTQSYTRERNGRSRSDRRRPQR